MAYLIKTASRKEFDGEEILEMHQLRAKVFKYRLGWDVPIINGMEIDGFDTLDPYYMMIREPGKGLRGCWRVLPTEGPYMLKNTFPQLLYGHPIPNARHIWELSRFAIETESQHGYGFSDISIETLREIVTFGDKMGIERYVTVTTPSIERMMRSAGLKISRYGPPMRIGAENAVAIDFDIGNQTREALFGNI